MLTPKPIRWMRCAPIWREFRSAPRRARACYIPVGHTGPDGDGALSLGGGAPRATGARARFWRGCGPLFEDPGVLKVGQNLKYDMLVLSRYGVRITPIDDTMLLSYALDAGLHGHGMDELSKLHLGHTPIAFKEVTGSGQGKTHL